jgi:hypothetical protein
MFCTSFRTIWGVLLKTRRLKRSGGRDRHVEGGPKLYGPGADLIDQKSFYVETGKKCRRAHSHGAQVRAGRKTLDQPLPTNVDMTRRYSILSPAEFDGEVRGKIRTIVTLPTGGLL